MRTYRIHRRIWRHAHERQSWPTTKWQKRGKIRKRQNFECRTIREVASVSRGTIPGATELLLNMEGCSSLYPLLILLGSSRSLHKKLQILLWRAYFEWFSPLLCSTIATPIALRRLECVGSGILVPKPCSVHFRLRSFMVANVLGNCTFDRKIYILRSSVFFKKIKSEIVYLILMSVHLHTCTSIRKL